MGGRDRRPWGAWFGRLMQPSTTIWHEWPMGVNTIYENDSWSVLISIPWLKCLNDLDVCLLRSRFCPWCWLAPLHPDLAHPTVAMNADCVALVSPTRARWTDTVFYINPISQGTHVVYATKCTPEGTVWNGTCTWCTSQTKSILNNALVICV